MRIAIIGAGAAGCFCAIHLRRFLPEAQVEVFEGGSRPLAKVAITGGGRCNLTNSFRSVSNLQQVYPRGDKLMKRALSLFSHTDTFDWFQREGVRLFIQEDDCVFPVSQDAMQIVDTLVRLMRESGVVLHLSHRVSLVEPSEQGYRISFQDKKLSSQEFNKVIVATGGSPRLAGLQMLEPLQLQIIPPVPSLFTFNIQGDWMPSLMGTVVKDVSASLVGTRFRASGPLLITHWGMSGPAILKLSSYAARHLAEQDYRGNLSINWFGNQNQEEVFAFLQRMAQQFAKKQMLNEYPHHLTAKHWQLLLHRSGIIPTQRWGELGKRQANKLATTLTSDIYAITGKSPHREEFVTCGGVALSNINLNSLECKNHPGLFFAGEVLDVDAITGGFNLQAAWSMGYVIASALKETC